MEKLTVTQLEAESIVATASFDTKDLLISGESIVDDIRAAAKNIVTVDALLDDGTKIATIAYMNGLSTDIYAPNGGGSSASSPIEYSSWQVYATSQNIAPGTVSPYPDELIAGYESTTTTTTGKAYRAYDPNDQQTKVVVASQSSKMKIPFVTQGWENYWTVANNQDNPEYFIHYSNGVNSVLSTGEAVGRTEGFCVRSSSDPAHCDVSVDWGDGSIDTVKDSYVDNLGIYTKSKDGEYEFNYYFAHTYAEDGYYDVKVFGRDYWGLRHQILTDNVEIIKPTDKDNSNIMCQVFTPKYRIASWVTNLSRFCINAHKLLTVRAPNYSNLLNLVNLSYMFSGADNLKYAFGFTELCHAKMSYDAQYMFENCKSLTYTDMRLASCTNVGKGWNLAGSTCNMFAGCVSLRNCPASLLPGSGFTSKYVSLTNAFLSCYSMTMTDTVYDGKVYTNVDPAMVSSTMADFLWNDTTKIFDGSSTLLSKTSNAVRRIAPASWGGDPTLSA